MILFCIIISLISTSFLMHKDPDYINYEKNIEPGHGNNINTKIFLKAGEMHINPVSSDYLAECTFRFYKEEWRPDISYTEDNNKGYLEIISPDFDLDMWKDHNNHKKNEWDIGLNKNMNDDINIEISAGEADINLEECSLRRLDFKIGAGEVSLNLRNSSVPRLSFKGGAGEAKIDLSGHWKNDLDARIKGGVGEITLILPSDIGIELNISGILGERNVPGFYKDGSRYTNRLNGKTKNNLFIDVNGGIGTVNVISVR